MSEPETFSIALTESERVSGLSEERLALARRQLNDAGFVVFGNAFAPEFVQSLADAYEPLLEKHIESMGGWERLDGKTFGEKHVGFFPPLFQPLADERLAAHPVALQVARAALGEGVQCSFFHTNTAYPGSGYQPVHRDTGHLFPESLAPTPPTHLVVNVPLCRFTVENGATEVWPASHWITDLEPADAAKLDERAENLPSIRTILPVGSLVLRDLRTWHRGTPNLSRETRTMIAIVYQREWTACKTVNLPESTWDSWSPSARKLYRNNVVVPDDEHAPTHW